MTNITLEQAQDQVAEEFWVEEGKVRRWPMREQCLPCRGSGERLAIADYYSGCQACGGRYLGGYQSGQVPSDEIGKGYVPIRDMGKLCEELRKTHLTFTVYGPHTLINDEFGEYQGEQFLVEMMPDFFQDEADRANILDVGWAEADTLPLALWLATLEYCRRREQDGH